MEISKQEMELFIPFPGLRSKNFFYKMFLIFTQEFKRDIQNRKQNYSNMKWNHLSHFQASDKKNFFFKMFLIFTKEFKGDIQNRKWKYSSNFQASYQKTSFAKCFIFISRSLELIFKTLNIIIQTRNENDLYQFGLFGQTHWVKYHKTLKYIFLTNYLLLQDA